MRPDFLPIPARTAKPRSVGLTHVLDKGMAPDDARRLVDRAGHVIDIWKLGWGQQAWLIQRFSANVNLGNIASNEVFAVEALRLGLRADTIGLVRQRGAGDATAGA